MTNLIVFPPTFLLVQFFRRIKRRNTRISRIKQILKQTKSQNMSLINVESRLKNEKNTKETKKNKNELKFPWWFKIFAYFLSFSFATVSLFFVIVKGIEFGDERVQKWLTSLIISFFSSLLLTQPLQVSYLFFEFLEK